MHVLGRKQKEGSCSSGGRVENADILKAETKSVGLYGKKQKLRLRSSSESSHLRQKQKFSSWTRDKDAFPVAVEITNYVLERKEAFKFRSSSRNLARRIGVKKVSKPNYNALRRNNFFSYIL